MKVYLGHKKRIREAKPCIKAEHSLSFKSGLAWIAPRTALEDFDLFCIGLLIVRGIWFFYGEKKKKKKGKEEEAFREQKEIKIFPLIFFNFHSWSFLLCQVVDKVFVILGNITQPRYGSKTNSVSFFSPKVQSPQYHCLTWPSS